MSLKAFKTIDKLSKLYEAADDEDDNGDDLDSAVTAGDMAEPPAQDDTDAEGGEPEPGSTPEGAADGQESDDTNPEIQADSNDGVFISKETKAEFAKTILNALLYPPTGDDDLLMRLKSISPNDITVDNADLVIKRITELCDKTK